MRPPPRAAWSPRRWKTQEGAQPGTCKGCLALPGPMGASAAGLWPPPHHPGTRPGLHETATGPISPGSPGSSGHLRARLPLSCASTHLSLWLHWTHPEESPDQGGLTGDTYQMFKEKIAPVLPNLLQKAEGRTPPRSPSQASITLRPDEGRQRTRGPPHGSSAGCVA